MQQDLFNQLPTFSHTVEKYNGNQTIYNKEKSRLSLNSWVLLFAMCEGQHITGLDCMRGISFEGLNKPVIMIEYRRRITELISEGVEIMKLPLKKGCKEYFIPSHLLMWHQSLYYPFKQTILDKINR